MSKFCTYCGKPLTPAERFCSNCGKQLAPAPAPAPVYNTAPAPEYTPSPKSKKPLIISLCAGGAALLIALVLIFVFAFGEPYEKAVNDFVDVLNGDI